MCGYVRTVHGGMLMPGNDQTWGRSVVCNLWPVLQRYLTTKELVDVAIAENAYREAPSSVRARRGMLPTCLESAESAGDS